MVYGNRWLNGSNAFYVMMLFGGNTFARSIYGNNALYNLIISIVFIGWMVYTSGDMFYFVLADDVFKAKNLIRPFENATYSLDDIRRIEVKYIKKTKGGYYFTLRIVLYDDELEYVSSILNIKDCQQLISDLKRAGVSVDHFDEYEYESNS